MARREYSPEELREIVSLFQVFGDISAITPYGSGHINDTFKVDLSLGGSPVSYILQRVNDSIFTRPDLMMENILRVTAHIRSKFAGQSDATRRTLTVIPSRDGKGWARGPNGGWWRMYVFIAGARTVDLISEAGQAHKAARAFAEFQNHLADLPTPRLWEIIPNFHNTRTRLEQLDTAAAADVRGRRASVSAELAFVDAHREEAGRVLDLMASGDIPERITHNDTKINNVMLDDSTGDGVAVIDLDTVMPGSALYDFGDMVRSATLNMAEDSKDYRNVVCRRDIFEALAKGFVEAGDFLNASELGNLTFGGLLMTLECGVRFLTDYLAGDVYFHTTCDDHNLVRARTQFKMVRSMAEQAAEYEAIVRAAARGR